MRSLLERSGLARGAVVLVAAACVFGLVRAAGAENNIGLRLAVFETPPQQAVTSEASPAPIRQRLVRRAGWTMARTPRLRFRTIRLHRGSRTVTIRPRALTPRRSVAMAAPGVIFLSPPKKPAVVSIFADKTLRGGDAVMLADGVHVFRGAGPGPFRPADFVRLSFAAGLDLHLRQTLNAFDHNPPTRWTSLEAKRA